MLHAFVVIRLNCLRANHKNAGALCCTGVIYSLSHIVNNIRAYSQNCKKEERLSYIRLCGFQSVWIGPVPFHMLHLKPSKRMLAQRL